MDSFCICGSVKDRRATRCKDCHLSIKARKCSCGQLASNRSGVPLCNSCRNNPVSKSKTCIRCGELFSTTTGNRKCPQCQRSHTGYDSCPDCGEKKDKRANRCIGCHGKYLGESGQAFKAGEQGGNGRSRPDGSKKIDGHGYVVIKMINWPTSVRGWIREHRYVMEQHLGRSLLPTEQVHHKNGQKEDNALSNLELWSKSQPTGQRVEDLLIWAREIITLYG